MEHNSGTDRDRLAQALELKLSFDERWDASSVDDRHLIVRALWDCANTLSRRLGFRPDEFAFGSDGFNSDHVEYIMIVLEHLSRHAETHGYYQGVTAVTAMQAVAALQHLVLSASEGATLTSAKLRLSILSMRLKALVEQYHSVPAGQL